MHFHVVVYVHSLRMPVHRLPETPMLIQLYEVERQPPSRTPQGPLLSEASVEERLDPITNSAPAAPGRRSLANRAPCSGGSFCVNGAVRRAAARGC